MNLQEATMPDLKKLTKREQLNRYFLIGSFAVGILLVLLMTVMEPNYVASNAADISAVTAIIFAVLWGLGMPVIAYIWHIRAIDEQEAAAYRDGAYYAAYALMFGAPTWWVLAKGNVVPPVNNEIIFIIFNFIWLGVWFYKKYA
jgi:hypothetical protein